MATPERDDNKGGTGKLSDRVLSETAISAIPISRHELAVAVLVALVGFGLRVAFPSRMAVEHFDEGVYASNLFFDASQGYRFPNQHLYAPPLLPWLIEWVFILFGPSNVGAMVPSIIAGSLTVPLMWWVGRRWFGPTAGLAAAILCATNDIHILFSRSALTDVLLCFWLVLAVYLFWEAITRNHLGWAIAAGVATSLAWWTKYTGWLPLAITSAGLVLSWLLDRRTHTGWRRHATCWLISAGVAALLWLPWLWSLQPHGGYSAVAANHRGYVVGWNGWLESLETQVANQSELDGLSSWVGMAVALLFLIFSTRQSCGWCFTWNIKPWASKLSLVTWLLIGFPIGWVASMSIIVNGAVALLSIVNGSRRTRLRDTSVDETDMRVDSLSVSIVNILIGVLGFVIPFYSPYPRLSLPLLAGCWLATAMLVQRVTLQERELDSLPPAVTRRSLGLLSAMIALAVIKYSLIDYTVYTVAPGRERPENPPRFAPAGFEPRRAQVQIAEGIAGIRDSRSGSSNSSVVFYVYGEPSLYFQLRLAGAELVRPVEHLAFARAGEPAAPLPVFLLTGPHAERNPNFARQFDEVKERLMLVKEYEYQPSDLVWRDERRTIDKQPTYHIRLYRVL